jgi:hypothetical protein
MTSQRPKFLACGDGAVTIEFGTEIDDGINALCLAFDEALSAAAFPGVIESLPTYRSVFVQGRPAGHRHASLRGARARTAGRTEDGRSTGEALAHSRDLWCEFGIDLEDVAAAHSITANEVIRRHSERVYRVAMLGFLPGLLLPVGGRPVDRAPAPDRSTAEDAGRHRVHRRRAGTVRLRRSSVRLAPARPHGRSATSCRTDDPVFLVGAARRSCSSRSMRPAGACWMRGPPPANPSPNWSRHDRAAR